MPINNDPNASGGGLQTEYQNPLLNAYISRNALDPNAANVDNRGNSIDTSVWGPNGPPGWSNSTGPGNQTYNPSPTTPTNPLARTPTLNNSGTPPVPNPLARFASPNTPTTPPAPINASSPLAPTNNGEYTNGSNPFANVPSTYSGNTPSGTPNAGPANNTNKIGSATPNSYQPNSPYSGTGTTPNGLPAVTNNSNNANTNPLNRANTTAANNGYFLNQAKDGIATPQDQVVNSNGNPPGNYQGGNVVTQVAAGRNPFGSAGIDIMNNMAQAQAGGGNNVNSPYITHNVDTDSENGGGGTYAANSPRLTPDGAIINPNNPNDPLVQTGQVADNMIINPALVTYDPEFGVITPKSNVKVGVDRVGPIAFALAGGLLNPAVAMGSGTIFGGGLGVTGGGITGDGVTPGGSGEATGGGPGGVGNPPPEPPYLPDGTPNPNFNGPPAPSPDGLPPGTQPPAPVTDATTPPGTQPPAPVSGPPTPTTVPTPGPGIPAGVQNFLTRGATGLGLNALLNSGNTPTNTNTNNPNTNNNNNNNNNNNSNFFNPDGSINWSALINAGTTAFTNNQSIQTYRDISSQLFGQGDYNSQYRPGQLSLLNQMATDPNSVINNDPTYIAGREQDVGNLQRRLNAQGSNLSGGEESALLNQAKLDDQNYINTRINTLRGVADQGNPDQLAGAFARNLPQLFTAINNRNGANAANGSSLLTSLVSHLPSGLQTTLTNWINGGAQGQPPADVMNALTQQATANGETLDQYITALSNNPSTSLNSPNLLPPADPGDGGADPTWGGLFSGDPGP